MVTWTWTQRGVNLNLPPKPDNAQVNDSSVDFFNHKVMRIFSDLISDRDSTEAIPAYFLIGASRITNMNFTGTRKMMMAYGMARLQGCPFCTYALNNCKTRLQTDVQPSTYASAVSMTNSHNHPVKIENFLRNLNLGMPELLRWTFK